MKPFIAILLLFSISYTRELIQITDLHDKTNTISNPKIYYSSKKPSGLKLFYTPDVETDGVRATLNDGKILLRWDKIQSLMFLHNSNEVIAISRNNTKKRITFIKPSKDGLVGDTEFGNFSIKFADIKNINVISDTKE